MDPTETLRIILELTHEMAANRSCAAERGAGADVSDLDAEMVEQGAELAGLVQDLDDWIRSGGFLPKTWQLPKSR
jgi:hypothetical protein